MSFSLLGISCLILAVRHVLMKWRFGLSLRHGHVAKQSDDEQLAEVDGETWPGLSVYQHVERGLKKNPHGPAVICLMEQSDSTKNLIGGSFVKSKKQSQQPTIFTLTYTQLHHTALKLASGLLAVGVRPNMKMMMLIPNGVDYAVLLWTCILLRITYVNIELDCLETTGFIALKHRLQCIKPQIVVAPDVLRARPIDDAISQLGLPQPVRLCLSDSASASTAWKSLFAVAIQEDSPGLKGDADTDAADANNIPSLVLAARHDDSSRINSIMFTSGTSGMPKGCPQTVKAISHALHSQQWLIDPDSGAAKHALMQPHNSRGIAPAQTLQTWQAGGAVVLTGQTFSVHDAITAIKQLGASFLVLTPPMVHEFAVELAAKPMDLYCVKRIQIGGDAVTKQVLIQCAALFPGAQVCVNQGMTEGPGVFTWPFLDTSPQDIPFYGGQICPVGVVAPGARIRLCSPLRQGVVVKRGEIGELHISCPSLIDHYLGGHSEKSFYQDKDGRWFNTGDMAVIDSHGLVFILGRRKDMIERAGVTLAPAVIESCVAALTQCQTVVVTVPHPKATVEPIAVVESFANATLEQVQHHILEALGQDYAVGNVVSLDQLGLAAFPVNATHKIIKSEVQDAVMKYMKQRSN